MMNILLINGHQRWEGFAEGKLNQTIIDETQKQLTNAGYEVKTTIVESGYDIAEELDKYKWADAVFVQTPVYWMSVPYLFKKYMDEVFTSGIGEVLCTDDGRTRSDLSKKYGSGGLMNKKKYMLSTTWNAPLESFEDPAQFFEGKGVDGVFMWLHKAFQFFSMEPLPSFSCHDVLKDADIESDLKRLEAHLANSFPAI
ncbi:MAG: NAD(P)H-dependent oxidoreductase [Desulfobacteraceae bacterium]|nr:NAD(P)H-dependent oxidoreductase [Desulfobacteraceae bacterium]